jgi:hypothetical protein
MLTPQPHAVCGEATRSPRLALTRTHTTTTTTTTITLPSTHHPYTRHHHHRTPPPQLGVVGRTGAGKSSLVAALARLTEPAAGRLLLAGVDLRRLGLARARGALSVVGQEPVLFAGSLRRNLDPAGRLPDADLAAALAAAGLGRRRGRRAAGGWTRGWRGGGGTCRRGSGSWCAWRARCCGGGGCWCSTRPPSGAAGPAYALPRTHCRGRDAFA